MMILTKDLVKKHLRLDVNSVNSDEKENIEVYIDAAEEMVLNYLERDYYDLVSEFGSVPKAVELACLMMVDHYYQHRGVATSSRLYDVPFQLDALLKPLMRF